MSAGLCICWSRATNDVRVSEEDGSRSSACGIYWGNLTGVCGGIVLGAAPAGGGC